MMFLCIFFFKKLFCCLFCVVANGIFERKKNIVSFSFLCIYFQFCLAFQKQQTFKVLLLLKFGDLVVVVATLGFDVPCRFSASLFVFFRNATAQKGEPHNKSTNSGDIWLSW